jgi:hypothetical protein
MIKCPFCAEQSETEELMNSHVVVMHPEKCMSAEAIGDSMRRATEKGVIWSVAATLTHTSVAGGTYVTKEGVLATFKWFLNELYKG